MTAVGLLGACASARPGIMSFDAYRRVQHAVPYVLELDAPPGRLLYYGGAHVYADDHPQIADIQTRWASFRPTYALNEGGDPPVFDTIEETVSRNGESALVRWLAKRDNVPATTLEPSRSDTVAALSRRFTPAQVKIANILRGVAQERRRSESFRVPSIDGGVDRLLAFFSRVRGLEGSPHSLREFDEMVRQELPTLSDWRAIDERWFNPALRPPLAWTNELAILESAHRNAFMIQRIVAMLQKGHRLFIVVGASHVVMQEAALRWSIRYP